MPDCRRPVPPPPAPALRRGRAENLFLHGTAVAVVLGGCALGADFEQHATVTGIDPALAPHAIAVGAGVVKLLFAGLAAGIRPPRRRAR